MRGRTALAGLLALLAVGLSTAAGVSTAAGGPGAGAARGPEPASSASARAESLLGRLPIYFIENRGQEDPRVAYYVPGHDIATYFTADGVTFAFSSPMPPRPRRSLARAAAAPSEPVVRERWALKLELVGADRAVMPRGQDMTPAVVSYFKGPESEWKTGLRTYAGVIYPDLWPGIDLVYAGVGGQLKYAFHVKPGADPTRIRLAYHGATAMALDRGRLEVSTPLGGFSDERPYAYQEVDGQRREVRAAFALAGGRHTFGFDVGAYDPRLPLVLDPGFLVYSGYIGGTGFETANAIAVDSAGSAYVVGATTSTVPSFPGTIGPDLTQNGDFDAYVAKVAADGSGLVYAGYVGGSSFDEAQAVAVDSAHNAYVTGRTSSTQATFPKKVGPGLTYNGGAFDAFVAKIKPDGTGLVYAGYIGGAGDDGALAIAVGSSGNAYVAGRTDSTQSTFPVTVGPNLSFNGGGFDAFVAKVKPDGSGLVYAGYIGGAGSDVATGIAVNSAGNAYVVGLTASDQTTFPVIVGPDLTFNGGGFDGFVAKVKADGTGLVYAGYLGGAGDDDAGSVAVDSAGSAYVVGNTKSDETSFPVKTGPGLQLHGGNNTYVAKVKADGTGLAYAGYIGPSDPNSDSAVAVDSAGSAHVAGTTSAATGFPLRAGPDLIYNGGAFDVFVAKVKPDGAGLLFSGYFGGTAQDLACGIALDSSANVYIAGVTFNFGSPTNFPALVGPDLIPSGGNPDTFVAKLSGKPDLVEGALTIPGAVKPGGTFVVTSAALNEGLGTATASTTRYYLSADPEKSADDILLGGSKAVPVLVPSAIVSGSATVTVPASTPVGAYFVLACADDSRVVNETDESNCAASSSPIQVTLPDLRETSVSNPPASSHPGQSFSVTDTVQNFGAVAAGTSTTRYYLSTDTAKGSGDILLTGTRSIAALNAGATSTGSVTVTIPSGAAPGTYRLLACADDQSVVAETSEGNNCRASTGSVAVSGTGTFALSPAAATVLAGDSLLYRLTWTTPTVWRDLATLQLRFVDVADGTVIFWVLWDETGNTLQLVNDEGAPIGRAALPGSGVVLQTKHAALRLARTAVLPGGPTAPDVTLVLAMAFKSEAAGRSQRDYRVEVLATDDFGGRQGFAPAGTLRVELEAPACGGSSAHGSATAVGTDTDSASVKISGRFTVPGVPALDQATVTLTSLLDEVGGAGELTRAAGGIPLLPVALPARRGSKPTDAIYVTPSGARPGVRVELTTRDPATGLVEFSIRVDRATIPAGPVLCAGNSPPTSQLRTAFSVQTGVSAPLALDLTLPWRCLGTQLRTP